jgi:hypothetical protein
MGHRVRTPAADAPVVTALLLSVACWAALVPSVIDISVADEALYLRQGLQLPQDGLPSPQWAPLYSLWYFALSLAQPDAIGLFYLNYTALTVAVPLLLYVHLRQSRISAALSGVVAGLYLWSATNIDVWPYPSRFACLLLLVALTVASSRRFVRHAGLVLVVALFLLSYVRPEYFVSWAVTAFVVVGVRLRSAWRDRQQRHVRVAAPIVSLAVAFAAWMIVFGVPLSGGDRAERAFAQHVARNHATQTGINAESEYAWVMRSAFRGAHSAWEALLRNPSMFARHVAANAEHALPRLAEIALLQPTERLFAPARGHLVEAAIGLVVLAALAGLLVFARTDRAAVRELAAQGSDTLRLQLLALVAISCAVVPAALVIYPRPHYLQVLGLLLTILAARAIAMCAALLRTRVAWKPGRSQWRATALSAVLLLVSLGAAVATLRATPVGLPYRATVLFLRKLRSDFPIRMLAPTVSSASFNVYLEQPVVLVSMRPRPGIRGDFLEFIAREQVDAIVWPGQFLRFPSYRDDPVFLRVMEDPKANGFEGIDMPGAEGLFVLINQRSSLLALVRPPALLDQGTPAAATSPAEEPR